MKLKNLKTKHLVALALALLMVMPALLVGVHATYPASGTPPYLDVVPTGHAANTSGSNYTLPVYAVGTTFSVDVRIDNYADVNVGGPNNGISGASYVVYWPSSVLKFDNYTDGAYLTDQSNAGDIPPTSSAVGSLTIGQIAFDTSNAQVTNDNAAGTVSCSINFTVTAPGSYNINVDAQGAGVPLLIAPPAAPATTALPVTGVLAYGASYAAVTSLSLYYHGTTLNSYSGGSSPINNPFEVDVFLSNPNQIPIWGFNFGLSWNTAILQLTNIQEGTYLASVHLNNSAGATTLWVPGWVDNNDNPGSVPQGISDVYLSFTTQNATSGVLAVLTFTPINYAPSATTISLVQSQVTGTPTLETLAGTNHQTPTPVTPLPVLNSFTYGPTTAPAATSPTAVITQVSPTNIVGTIFTSGTGSITVSDSNSLPGQDPAAFPLSPTMPIVSYSWSYIAAPSSGAPALFTSPQTFTSGAQFTFNVPTVTQAITYTLTLTVSTASEPGYSGTASVSISFLVQPTQSTYGPAIDVYTTNNVTPNGNNGQPLYAGDSPPLYNANAGSDSFGPQQTMGLGALVTYNAGPVANKEVVFYIEDTQGNVIGTVTALTNGNGIATTSYELPWYDGNYVSGGSSSPVSEFGVWSVFATVQVQSTTVNDTMPFYFGDLIAFNSATWTAQNGVIQPSTLSAPITGLPNPAYKANEGSGVVTSETFNVHLLDYSHEITTCYVVYTVLDNGNVPVATGETTFTFSSGATLNGAGSTFTVTPSTQTATLNFNIPSYAFLGTATIQVNVFNVDPYNTAGLNSPPHAISLTSSASSAVPYCPQASNTFTIVLPPSAYPSAP
ncbi:MAG TPA: hypothetical protein VK536_09430 [Candidatus Limnocylindrales bacterium]|nr:hypothetical protein [Candidatus Limnocylindrales bacterium]